MPKNLPRASLVTPLDIDFYYYLMILKFPYLALSIRNLRLALSPTEPACRRWTSDLTWAQWRAVSSHKIKLIPVTIPIGITKNI